VRVVFDTNIFISALAIPGGRGEEAVNRVLTGRDELVMSKAIILEILGVLARKFERDREQLARVAVFLADIGEIVEPRNFVHRLADEPDNRILECAVKGSADVIVTGDKELLALGEFGGARIVSLRRYLDSG